MQATELRQDPDWNEFITMVSFSVIGDTFHIINLINILIYGIAMFWCGVSANHCNVFDQQWLKEGFCLHNTTTPYWTTHDVSGYLIIFITLLGFPVLHFGKRAPGMKKQAYQLTFWAMIGALGHATGHFLIAHGKRLNFYPPGDICAL